MSKRSALGRLLFTAVVVLAFLSLIPIASASVVGTLSEANCATGAGGGVTVNASTITWLPQVGTTNFGCILSGSGTNLTWSGGGSLGAGATGQIQNLAVGGTAVNNFIDFLTAGLDFTLTSFAAPTPTSPGNCVGLASGQTCTAVIGSPFLLTNDAILISGILIPETGISLVASGTVYDPNNPSAVSGWTGVFTTQLNESPADVAATIAGGGSVTSTQSGAFVLTSGVPEPVTLPLIGGGLMALAMLAKKRKTRA